MSGAAGRGIRTSVAKMNASAAARSECSGRRRLQIQLRVFLPSSTYYDDQTRSYPQAVISLSLSLSLSLPPHLGIFSRCQSSCDFTIPGAEIESLGGSIVRCEHRGTPVVAGAVCLDRFSPNSFLALSWSAHDGSDHRQRASEAPRPATEAEAEDEVALRCLQIWLISLRIVSC